MYIKNNIEIIIVSNVKKGILFIFCIYKVIVLEILLYRFFIEFIIHKQ